MLKQKTTYVIAKISYDSSLTGVTSITHD